MSAYKLIKTQFKNRESLIAALKEVIGDGQFAVDADLKNKLALYGYKGDIRPERCSVKISAHVVNRYSGGCSNDVGFSWNGETRTFESIVSEYDQRSGTMAMLEKVKQSYAVHELTRQARLKGYAVQRQQAGQVVRLKLVPLGGR